MNKKYLRKKYPDITFSKITMDAVYACSDIVKRMTAIFKYEIVELEHSGKSVSVAASKEFGANVEKMKLGSKVRMTGAEIKMNPENDKEWTIIHEPIIMCGEYVVFLEGYSGAYSCEFLEPIK